MRSPCCMCVCVSPPIVVRQRLGKHVPAVTNTHGTIEEFLDASFSMRSVLYQRICSSQNLLLLLLCYSNSPLDLYVVREFLKYL
jgi:hypothetical protein